MTFLLILIPLLAAVAIGLGAPGRLTAVAAAVANLALGLCAAATAGRDCWAREWVVMEKPRVMLAFGMDGLSAVMVALGVLVTLAAVLSGRCPEGREKLWYSSILLIAAGALGAFVARDLVFFYAFHELALVPTFLMIGMLGRGGRSERMAAAWKITIYLALGSMVLLAGLVWLAGASGSPTLLFRDLLAAGKIDPAAQKGIAALLIVGFGTLVSLFPFHSWAAPAYAAAPAPVAMLHAGVLKKFGLYGLLRLYPVVSEGLQAWLVPLIVLLLGNILWVGLVTLNQKRLDLMLGNSSVMHMGYVFLAIAALVAAGKAGNPLALPAAAVLMFAHGVSIALLFSLAERVESRTGSLYLADLGGLAKPAPALAFLFGLAGMASIGLPGLANFAGEVMVFFSGFRNWSPGEGFGPVQVATILALWGVVLSAVYMLRAFRKTFQGEPVKATMDAADLTLADRLPAFLLAAALLAVGCYPKILLCLLS